MQVMRTIGKSYSQWTVPSRLYRNAYALVGNNILVAATSYLFWLVCARWYTDSDVGVTAAALSAMAVLATLSDLGLGMGLIRFLPGQHDEDAAKRLVRAAGTVRLILTLALTLVFVSAIPWLVPGLLPIREDTNLLLVFVALTIANGLYLLHNSVYLAWRQAGYVLLAGILVNVGKLGGLVVSRGVGGPATILLSIALPMAMAVFLGSILRGLPLLPELLPSWRRHLAFLRYSTSNQSATILVDFPALVVPLLVISVLGAQANAYFYTGWMLAGILRTACVSVSQSAFAEGSSAPAQLPMYLWHSLGLCLALVLFGGTALVVAGPWLLSAFGASYAQHAGSLLGWLVLAVFPFAASNLLITALRVQRDIAGLLVTSAGVAGFTLLGAILGIVWDGLDGLVIGWAIGQFAAAALAGTILVWHRRTMPVVTSNTP